MKRFILIGFLLSCTIAYSNTSPPFNDVPNDQIVLHTPQDQHADQAVEVSVPTEINMVSSHLLFADVITIMKGGAASEYAPRSDNVNEQTTSSSLRLTKIPTDQPHRSPRDGIRSLVS